MDRWRGLCHNQHGQQALGRHVHLFDVLRLPRHVLNSLQASVSP